MYDLAHAFYHNNNGWECRSNSCSFLENKFYSYYTCIGLIYTDKNGKKHLFYSKYNMSNTTSKHIGVMLNACPYDSKSEAPFFYREHYVNIESLANNFNKEIQEEMTRALIYSRKPDRERAEKLLTSAENFVAITETNIPLLDKYKTYISLKLNTEEIKKAKKEERQKAKIKREQKAREIAEFFERNKDIPLLDLIAKYVFSSLSLLKDFVDRDLLIESFGIDHPSFVIIDGDNVKTSQHITMPKENIIPLLRAWKHGHSILGQRAGSYTVVVNNSKMVKVGCHKIPYANVKALADALL